MDYIKKLQKKDLEYLNQFMGEYVSGAFKKTEEGEYSDENLHKTVEERRECYTRNNTRNRCGLTISNATGQTYRADDINSFMDSLTDADVLADSSNLLSDLILDEYSGDIYNLEKELLKEMLEDYERCINPKTNKDRELAESNYGKSLMLKFNDFQLNKKS